MATVQSVSYIQFLLGTGHAMTITEYRDFSANGLPGAPVNGNIYLAKTTLNNIIANRIYYYDHSIYFEAIPSKGSIFRDSTQSIQVINDGTTIILGSNFIPPLTTLDIATISNSTGDVTINDNLIVTGTTELDNFLKMGTGLSTPTNVSDSVLILKSKTDATYGNPTSSSIIYSDVDNILKSKNTSGNVFSLREALFYYGIFTVAVPGTSCVIFNANTETLVPLTFVKVSSSVFTQVNSLITYTGPNRFISGTASYATTNTSAVDFGRRQICMVQNPTLNGNFEVTGGTIYTGAIINANGVNPVNVFMNFGFQLNTNDTLAVAIRNNSNTNSVLINYLAVNFIAYDIGLE